MSDAEEILRSGEMVQFQGVGEETLVQLDDFDASFFEDLNR